MPTVRAVAQVIADDVAVLVVHTPDRQYVSAVEVPSLSLATGGVDAARAKVVKRDLLWHITPGEDGHLAKAEPILGDQPLAAMLTQAGSGWRSTVGHPMPWATVTEGRSLAEAAQHYANLAIGGMLLVSTFLLLALRRQQQQAATAVMGSEEVERLRVLQDLRERGGISEDEFQRQKAALLAQPEARGLRRVAAGLGNWVGSLIPIDRTFARNVHIERRDPKP